MGVLAGTSIELWLLGAVLVLLAGLNAPLGGLALGLAAAGLPVAIRTELDWIATPSMRSTWSGLLVIQFLADLYFVPTTVRDAVYVERMRTETAYLHARLQSFVRPLVAALILAALPFSLPAQIVAVVGFLGGMAVYWASAWVREQVAISRGSLILLLLEMAKNLVALVVSGLVASLVPVAITIMGVGMLAVAWWAGRLRREHRLYPPIGGQVASEDS